MNDQIKTLMSLRDEKYALFNSKLIPNIEKDTIIGIRIPVIRKYARELIKTGDHIDFINMPEHTYFEENMLHVCIISLLKDYNEVMVLTEKFLPYIDNWAVCDSFAPKIFSENKESLYEKIKVWIVSDSTYTVRFAINMLMKYFMHEDFLPEHLHLVSGVKGEDYYIKTAVSWYFATAMSVQYEQAVKIIQSKTLEKFIHNKTIQKCTESYRISDEKKEYLKSLKIK